MKKTIAVVLIAGWSAWAVADDAKVQYNQLPQPVQKTLDASKGTHPVKEIERTTKDGKTVYEVELERTGFNKKLVIAEDGSLVQDTKGTLLGGERTTYDGGLAPDGAILPRIQTMKLSEVPEVVQNTINQHAAGRKIADIDKETWNGRTVYEVEFAQAGRNAQIHVAEDGSMVTKDQKPATGTDTAQPQAGRSLFGVYLGTQLEDTPAAVQQTIQREGKGLEIADIDLERRTGSPVYEVEFKRPGGNFELHIAANGSVVKDSRRNDAVGGTVDAPDRTQTGSSSDVSRPDSVNRP